MQSRLPYEAIWIEYDLRAYQAHANEIRGTKPPEPWEIPSREGWLIQQHPNVDTAYVMHMFTQDATDDPIREDGFDLWTFPFAFGWCADDSPLPWWPTLMIEDGSSLSFQLVGVGGYERPNVNCVRSALIVDPKRDDDSIRRYQSLLREWTGVVRRVWALLATMNDLPTTIGEVRQTKGFLSRGSIRKYLSHSTITLNIPARKDARVLARQMIAAAHRRRHPVRAHWRDDWRNPPASQCDHLWEIVDEAADRIQCARCRGRQTFIHKHERGDATLGWVSHSYNVTHKEEEET